MWLSQLFSRVLWLCCRQTKGACVCVRVSRLRRGRGACGPDVSRGVRPRRLIRLIRAGNLAGWQWTVPLMRLNTENSQDGWGVTQSRAAWPACCSSSLTCERLAPDCGIVSALNQNHRLKRPSRLWHFQTGAKHIFYPAFFFSFFVVILK